MRENETSITFVDSMGVLAEIENETFPPRGNKRTKWVAYYRRSFLVYMEKTVF